MTVQTAARAAPQPSLPTLCPIALASEFLAGAGVEERGAIYTRLEVVDFILDLTGYTTDRPLHRMRLLEPSFGDGDFLLPVIDRLLTVWQASPERAGSCDLSTVSFFVGRLVPGRW